MENRICPECKTENEPEYTYCKNCGTPLSTPTPAKPTVYDQPKEGGDTGILIDGNPIDKVVTFVGKNADRIVPKFIKINESGSKTQWCWPPFIWGFFFGPIGVAIWFLYRKMYKPACLFGAIGIAVSYITAFLSHLFGIIDTVENSMSSYLNALLSGKPFDLQSFLSTFGSRDMLISNMISNAESILNIACALVAGLFGIYIYKKFAARKIHFYKPISNDPNYVKIGLAAAGGTSVGAAILGFIIISVIASAPSIILSIIELAGVVYGL